MKILAPVNSLNDVLPVINAGATELFCGIIPHEWSDLYGGTVSPNRREWSSANLKNYKELYDIVKLAHENNSRVFLTLNALYVNRQKELVRDIIKNAVECGADAFIIADIGLLYELKKMKLKQEIHISTGGTVFNSQTAKFYENMGVQRITFPRHIQPDEMKNIIQNTKSIKYEAFILNSGCKNIDGYCTFLHGVRENAPNKHIWKILKKLNFDRLFLRVLHSLPAKLSNRVNFSCSGADSPCIMKYDFKIFSDMDKKRQNMFHENLKSFFSLLSGADPCGACRIKDLRDAGIHSLKIVGRNYSKNKKITDVKFIKNIIDHMREQAADNEFERYVVKQYKKYYGLKCKKLCYYPK